MRLITEGQAGGTARLRRRRLHRGLDLSERDLGLGEKFSVVAQSTTGQSAPQRGEVDGVAPAVVLRRHDAGCGGIPHSIADLAPLGPSPVVREPKEAPFRLARHALTVRGEGLPRAFRAE